MQAFFSWYGSKWMGAKRFGKPMLDVVVEPFAGSACYCTYWEVQHALLYDIDENICKLWDFLINCSEDDIRRIPDEFTNADEYLALPDDTRRLVGFWVGYARTKPATKPSPWYYKQKEIAHYNARTWGTRSKEIIIRQKPYIKKWKIEQLSYEKIPDHHAHWFIDPPYNNKAGQAYTHCDIDYAHLAEWCKSRSGMIQVCENEGADWLPFTNPYEINSAASSRKKSREVIWEQSNLWYS